MKPVLPSKTSIIIANGDETKLSKSVELAEQPRACVDPAILTHSEMDPAVTLGEENTIDLGDEVVIQEEDSP